MGNDRITPSGFLRDLVGRAETTAKNIEIETALARHFERQSKIPPIDRFREAINNFVLRGRIPEGAIREVNFYPGKVAGEGHYILRVIPEKLRTRTALMPLGFKAAQAQQFAFYEMSQWIVPLEIMGKHTNDPVFITQEDLTADLRKIEGHEFTKVISTPLHPANNRPGLKGLTADNIVLWVRHGVSRQTLVGSDFPAEKDKITISGRVCSQGGGKPYEYIIIPEQQMPAEYRVPGPART